MCTLTLLPIGHGEGHELRIAFNRDESRLRTEAWPPRRLAFGDRTALMPIDPSSGGTWIALSDAGIALAVMNVNAAEHSVRAPSRSRGKIIPSLLHHNSFDELLAAVTQLTASDFAPFRLVIADLHEVAVVEPRGDGQLIQSKLSPANPLLFTSSGLGDVVVEGPRRELFESMVLTHPTRGSQDAFHRHRWQDRPHLSICMARSDARTVSHTVIHLTKGRGRLTYIPDSPDQPLQPETHDLHVGALETLCT